METHLMVALILAFVGLSDLALIPIVTRKVAPARKPLIALGLLGGSITMFAMAAIFWFRIIEI